jgi:MoxR-like ATPase
MDPPGRDEELTLAQRMVGADTPENSLAGGAVKPALTAEQLAAIRWTLLDIFVKPELIGYVVDVVRATRAHESILVGAGPRATQALLLASRAHAAIAGRDYISPDDIRAMATPVLEHRLILRPEYEIEGQSVPDVINSVLQQVAVPR